MLEVCAGARGLGREGLDGVFQPDPRATFFILVYEDHAGILQHLADGHQILGAAIWDANLAFKSLNCTQGQTGAVC